MTIKVRKATFSEDHRYGEECVPAQICTNSSSRQNTDKSFLIPQDTTKHSSATFFPAFSSSVYIGKMHISITKYGLLFIFLNIDIVLESFLT